MHGIVMINHKCWATIGNTDTNEGRGSGYVISFAKTPDIAAKTGLGQGVQTEAAWIDAVGPAYARNPTYAAYQTYKMLAEKGNTIVVPNNGNSLINIVRK